MYAIYISGTKTERFMCSRSAAVRRFEEMVIKFNKEKIGLVWCTLTVATVIKTHNRDNMAREFELFIPPFKDEYHGTLKVLQKLYLSPTVAKNQELRSVVQMELLEIMGYIGFVDWALESGND